MRLSLSVSSSGCQSVCDLIAARVEEFPHRLAVQEGDRQLTFRELDLRSNRLAAAILAGDANPDHPVGILLPGSIDLIVAELAVLKSGRAFLPIDPAYPAGRIEFIFGDAAIGTVITAAAWLEKVPIHGLHLIDVNRPSSDEPADIPHLSDPASLAYVMYTSGSSGKPKGVMVEHRNLMNLVHQFESALGLVASDRSSMLLSPSFDASIAEVWPYLAVGASVHIAPAGIKTNPAALLKWLTEAKVTVSVIPTALVKILLEYRLPDLPDLRILITGGEQLLGVPPVRLPFRFLNAYGPTECTVISTWAEIDPDPKARRDPPPIGKPIGGMFVRILDQDLKPVPDGAQGEICIGGAGVARGYLNHPELTEPLFIPDPLDPDGTGRLYRSGDFGYWLPDGELAFAGRRDRQLELHGIRIEPAEIELVLKQHETVEDAAVKLQSDGQISRLVAFVAAKSQDAAALTKAIRKRVQNALPASMHPARYVIVKRLPITVNGKVDYSRLPMPAYSEDESVSSAGEIDRDEIVRAVWRSTLSLGSVSDSEDFFAAGGDSLGMMVMLLEVEKRAGVHVDTGAFLHQPTLGHCIDLVNGRGGSDLPLCVVPLGSVFPPEDPFFCVGGAGGGVHMLAELANVSDIGRPFYGLESQAIPLKYRSPLSIPEVARQFLAAVREVQPAGPYRLGGYSLGGLIAIEMAHDLLDAGESVLPVILIGTYASVANPTASKLFWRLLHRLMTAPPADTGRFLADRLRKLTRRIRRRFSHSYQQAEMEFHQVDEVKSAVKYMQNDMTTCRVPLCLLTSRYGSQLAPEAQDRGWSRFAAAGLEVHQVPGDHFSMLDAPHVLALGQQLRLALGKS